MLTLAMQREIQRINSIINLIDGSKEKYNISIIPNVIDFDIYVLISDLKNDNLVYYNIFHTNNDNHIETINLLRDNFINSGVVVSKLTNLPNKEKTTYRYQELFKNNLQMFIQITNVPEEIAATKAHKKTRQPELFTNLSPQIKTIQSKSCIG